MEATGQQDHEDDPVSEGPAVCAQCGSGDIEPGFQAPLCGRCRTRLAHRPFPVWITASSVVLLAILTFAAIRSVESFRAATAFERGKRAERHKRYAEAADYYQQAVDRFPDSTVALARLAVTGARAGRAPEAARALNRLNGRKMTREQAAELHQAANALDRLFMDDAAN